MKKKKMAETVKQPTGNNCGMVTPGYREAAQLSPLPTA
jgi:hypothetical protein